MGDPGGVEGWVGGIEGDAILDPSLGGKVLEIDRGMVGEWVRGLLMSSSARPLYIIYLWTTTLPIWWGVGQVDPHGDRHIDLKG